MRLHEFEPHIHILLKVRRRSREIHEYPKADTCIFVRSNNIICKYDFSTIPRDIFDLRDVINFTIV